MAYAWELLDKAFYLIGQGRHSAARPLLDEVLRSDPQNVDAWNAYMRTCQSRGELESLKDYICRVWDAHVGDQDYMRATQRYVLQRVDERIHSL